MRPLSDTIGRLTALRRARAAGAAPAGSAKLKPLGDFGSNPGALDAYFYVPDTAGTQAPLVVVLHGCTQNAVGYDHGSGWSQLAEEQGFILLFPEQRRANNMNLCFSWFEPADSRRDAGEPLSIRQMIGAMVDRHGADPDRVFINGLSAGGAMTSVMLATYPELFAGGAIIAGLAFGSAGSVPEAFDRMRGHGGPGQAALAAAVRAASPHRGPWPTVSIWHGSADHTVVPANADAILAQWQAIHGVSGNTAETGMVDGHPHRVWRNARGRAVIEDYRITGMGHGTPLSTRGEAGCGANGPHMLETGISSTRHIARFWGLTASDRAPSAPRHATASTPASTLASRPAERASAAALPAAGGVGQVIENALRAAGLMR
ncbi:MAG: PHB depolymerase family esterase [Sphingomonas sp.]